MRERGLIVFASDIVNRDCPDSTILDFRGMVRRPCDVLVSNGAPPVEGRNTVDQSWSWLDIEQPQCGKLLQRRRYRLAPYVVIQTKVDVRHARMAAVPDGFLYRRKHTPGGSGQHCKGRQFPAVHCAPPS